MTSKDEALKLIATSPMISQVEALRQVQVFCNAQTGDYGAMAHGVAEWGALDKLMKSMLNRWVNYTFELADDGDMAIAEAIMGCVYDCGEDIAWCVHVVLGCAYASSLYLESCDECVREAVAQYNARRLEKYGY